MLTLLYPAWLWGLLVLPLLVLIAWRGWANLGRNRWTASVLLRSAVLAVLLVILAEPQYVRKSDGVTVVFALDHSHSIPESLRLDAQQYVRRMAKKAQPGDRIGIVGFDGRAEVSLTPQPHVDVLHFASAADPDRTDPAAAVRMAMAMMPSDTARRILLLTDGNENNGDVLSELDSATANAAVVDVVPLEYTAKNEILLDRLSAPAQVSPNSRVSLRLVARSTRAARAKLHLYHQDTEVPLRDPVIEFKGGMQPEVVSIPVELSTAGVHRFDVRISAEETSSDTVVQNNRATAFTIVQGKARVLILDPAEDGMDNQVLAEALQREKMDVDYRRLNQLRLDLLELSQYTAVVLGNISADALNDDQHQALANYVKNLGGGLVLLGGDNSFGAGGWAGRPLEEVSPVRFSIPNERVLPAAALVIVLDHSGSMGCPVAGTSKTQQQVANEAAILALKTLLSRDYAGLVSFDTQPTWVVPLERYTDPAGVANKIRNIGPGGGTDAFPAMEEAAKALQKIGPAASIKHVLLLTDGQTQPAPFEQLVRHMVQEGISVSTIGVGDGMNDPMLRSLAQLGGGTFHPVRNPRLLPQVFFRETRIIRKRLISEQPFKPNTVGSSFDPMAGIAPSAWPELEGYVRTEMKNDAMLALVCPEQSGDAPLLAYWQYRLGKVVAFTSGWWPHWGEKWTAWPTFGSFWKNVVEWAGRGEELEGFDVATHVDGTRGRVMVEAIGKDGAYLNGLNIAGVLVAPNQEAANIQLTQVGSGQYQAEFNTRQSGDYLVSLRVRQSEQDIGVIRTGLSMPYSPEFRELRANSQFLQKIAERGNGRTRLLADQEDNPFARDLPIVRSQRPIWSWMVGWLLLPLLLMDVAVRRLASSAALSIYMELGVLAGLIGVARLIEAGAAGYIAALLVAEVVGWSLRWRWFGATLRSLLAATRPASAIGGQTMAALRDTRQQLRQSLEDKKSHEELPARTTVVDQDSQPGLHPGRDVDLDNPEFFEPSQPAQSGKPQQAISDEPAKRLLRIKKSVRRKLDTPPPGQDDQ